MDKTFFGQITVGTTATLIRKANPHRKEILLTNSSSTTLYVGTNDQVTIDNGAMPGYEVLSQGSFYGDYKGDIYGIIDSGEIKVTYWEEEE